MASIGTTLPAMNQTPAISQSNSSSSSGQALANGLGNTSTFLNLLVAQLQNQDPTNPVDGTTFVTQLAEFNNVEQNLAVRTDMDAVSEKYLGVSTPPSASTDQTSSVAAATQTL